MNDIGRLRELLAYDPATGRLTWRRRPDDMFAATGFGGSQGAAARWNGRYAGKQAFTAFDSCGYPVGALFDHLYRAHRVIWALVTGAWPEGDIDHIDGDRSNNRWDNLRQVTRQQNCRNQALRSDNRSGVQGVGWSNRFGKWEARLGKSFVGYFHTKDAAASARRQAQLEAGYHENHGRTPIPHSHQKGCEHGEIRRG